MAVNMKNAYLSNYLTTLSQIPTTMETQNTNYCIILAGGIGRRLWPASQKEMPKQFIDFFGSGRTLLQQTYDRFCKIVPQEHIFISTFEDYVPLVQEQLPHVAEKNILPEPVQLNTAPAAIWGTWHAVLADPNANVVVTPADQVIQNDALFREQILNGLSYVAEHAEFLAIGVKPTHPNTAYGYIQMGHAIKGTADLYTVQSFSEKPESYYAKMFMESGEFLWNTGIFMWKGETMGKHISTIQHRMDLPVDKVAQQMVTIAEEVNYVRSCIPEGLPKSIDLLVLEHCDNVAVQACTFGWADVGCWSELREVSHTDADGNAVSGGAQVMLQGTQRSVVRLPKGMKAVVAGLDGYVVSLQGNTLMVCPGDDPDAVRRLINEAQMELKE